jgi:Ca2+-binding EF-hand superfamily protein
MENAIIEVRKLLDDQLAFNDFVDEKYNQADVKKYGILGMKELKATMTVITGEMGYEEPSDEIVEKTFYKYDKNRSGEMDQGEFARFVKDVLQTFLIAFDEDYE